MTDVRYIDSGTRHPNQALGTWLQSELTNDVTELRWQTGFFSADGLAPFIGTMERLSSANQLVRVLIGSNNGDTLEADVSYLFGLMHLPRSNGKLGVVSFSGSFYHPKTYHLRRIDGSEAAYVGSANLSLSGVGSLHVEAGIVLDTREGDPNVVLQNIATAIDDWFSQNRPGLEVVRSAADVSALLGQGILSLVPTPQPPRPTVAGAATRPARPRLQPLVRFRSLPRVPVTAPSTPSPPTSVSPTVTGLPAVPQNPPYPSYVLFAPGATAPTNGALAVSGATLPSGSTGLIVRLNRDSSRHWQGGAGTANISVPVPTVSSLRFGIYQGQRPRPRAEYEIEMRYLFPGNDLRSNSASTNVMVYGFTPGDTGHGDVRLVVPRAPARQLAVLIEQHGRSQPTDGDVALLEWPIIQWPIFRLSLLERSSPLYNQAASMLNAASASNQLVGQGACWLPPTLSPKW